MTLSLRWLLGVAALVVALIAATLWWTSNQAGDSEPSWLFSHTAEGGSLEPQPDGSFTLTLNNVDPHVIAFTDRPNRDAIVMDAGGLVNSWDAVFGDSPPNVVLVEHTPDGTTNSVALTISNPVLSPPLGQGDSPETERTLVFDAQLILDEAQSSSNGIGDSGGDLTASQSFESASLFIDTYMAFPVTLTCTYPDERAPVTETFLLSPDRQPGESAQFLVKCTEEGGTAS